MLPPTTVMYDALAQRDPTFEGLFWVGVRTTGIFCRPTCSARKPKPENVEYFESCDDALRAGYRACLRCRPTDPDGLSPAWSGRLHAEMERRGGAPIRDADLAALDLDAATVRRAFQRRYGTSFQSFQRARRLGRALEAIQGGATTTRAALDHGFESESGFREAFERLFGTTPRHASIVRCLRARWMDTPLGTMVGVADEEGLRLLEFADRASLKRELETVVRRLRSVILPGEHATLDETERALRAYFDGASAEVDVPIAPIGSDFQRSVWERLRAIPPGETASYAEVARDLGRQGGERAIGNACGANMMAIVVPCHRVVRTDGSLGGYAGGLWRKRRLLDLERSSAGVPAG